jgi:hypothetical protein
MISFCLFGVRDSEILVDGRSDSRLRFKRRGGVSGRAVARFLDPDFFAVSLVLVPSKSLPSATTGIVVTDASSNGESDRAGIELLA